MRVSVIFFLVLLGPLGALGFCDTEACEELCEYKVPSTITTSIKKFRPTAHINTYYKQDGRLAQLHVNLHVSQDLVLTQATIKAKEIYFFKKQSDGSWKTSEIAYFYHKILFGEDWEYRRILIEGDTMTEFRIDRKGFRKENGNKVTPKKWAQFHRKHKRSEDIRWIAELDAVEPKEKTHTNELLQQHSLLGVLNLPLFYLRFHNPLEKGTFLVLQDKFPRVATPENAPVKLVEWQATLPSRDKVELPDPDLSFLGDFRLNKFFSPQESLSKISLSAVTQKIRSVDINLHQKDKDFKLRMKGEILPDACQLTTN